MIRKLIKKRKVPIATLEKQDGFDMVDGKPTFLLKNGHGLKHSIGDIVVVTDGKKSHRYQIMDEVAERKIFTRLKLKHTIWQ